jgi:hypothetical protein
VGFLLRFFGGRAVIWIVTSGIVLAAIGSLFASGYSTGKGNERKKANKITIEANKRRAAITTANNKATAEDEVYTQQQIEEFYRTWPPAKPE